MIKIKEKYTKAFTTEKAIWKWQKSVIKKWKINNLAPKMASGFYGNGIQGI